MKGLIAILVLGGAGLVGWYAFSQATADDGELVGIAFGIPDRGEIEMHSIISNRMTVMERPRINLKGKTLWQEWVDQHFAMADDGGGAVPLRYKSSTDIIPHLDLRGFPQGFVVAHLKQGVGYTMEYRPKRAGPDRYRHSFTAPADGVPLSRPIFAPVQSR